MSPLSTACLVSFKRAIHITAVVIDHVTVINCFFSFIQKRHTYLCSNYRSWLYYQLVVHFRSKGPYIISAVIIDHATAINCLLSFIQRGHTYHCSNCRLLLSTAYPILFNRAINITAAYCSYCINHVTCIICLLNFIPERLKLEDIAGGWPMWTSLQYIKYSSDVLHPSDAES
jgi:hypothetical protein